MARTVNLVISGAVVMGTAIEGSGFLRRVVSAAAVLVACCGVLAGGAAAAAAAGPAPGAVTAWGVAQRIPGVNTIINVPADANATVVNSVSCAAPGDCAAGRTRWTIICELNAYK